VKERETVIDILKESCEFSESDELLDEALSKTLSPAPFQAAAAVSIQVLLPNEIKLAVRSRRSILLVGLANTGKTMITDTLRHMPSTVVPLPTVGRTVTVVAYREWIMQVNEIGGRHDFRTNWKHYLQLCEDLRGVIFVVDSAQRSQVSDATAYFHALMKHPKLRDRPVLVLANNSGAPKALSAQVLKDAFDLGSRPGCCLSQCDITHPGARSAMDDGLCRGLDWLCSRLRELSDPNSVPAVPKSVVATPTYVQSTD
jgi:ADP-ribosylation factor protein 1